MSRFLHDHKMQFVFLWSVFVPLCALGFWTFDTAVGVSAHWPAPVIMLTVLAANSRSTRFDRRATTRAMLVMPWLFTVSGLPFGYSPLHLLWMGVVTEVVMLGLLLTYRRFVRDQWFPKRPQGVFAFGILAGLFTAPLIEFGGVPGAVIGGALGTDVNLAWAYRIQIVVILGGFSGFTFWHSPLQPASHVQYRAAMPFLAVVSILAVGLPYFYPEYPIAWFMLIPAVWIGLCLTPRWATVALLVVIAVPSVLQHTEFMRMSADGVVSPLLSMELGLGAMISLTYVIVVFRESAAHLTDRVKAAADHGAAQNELLTRVIQSMNDGVLITNTAGEVVMSNPAARALLGRPNASSTQWTGAYGLRASDGSELDREQLTDLLAPPIDDFAQVNVQVPGGSDEPDRIYSLSARALFHRKQPLNVVVISDITASHSRQRELEAFAGTVAHDLKNPLAALALWVELAEQDVDDDPESGLNAIEQSRAASTRMNRMIDDYLAYTVTRAGVLRTTTLHLAPLVDDVIAVYAARESAPTFEVDADIALVADPALTRQLLANLVANSIKYARPGEPAYVRIRAQHDGEGWVRVAVDDMGVGIDEADCELIFKPFARTATGASANQGIGLGLALCQAIVQRHRGRIVARPNDWGGMTVEFTLPAAEDAPAPERVAAVAGRRPLS